MDEGRDRSLASYYDLEYRDYADDLTFYVQHALAMDPDQRWPVLELGCGTGRVALALAEAGFKVVGVDRSAGMLEMCRIQADERGVGERVELVESDMRRLEGLPGGSFNMAVCALNTFAYLTGTAEQLEMLRGVHPLMVQHGVLVLDLTPPLPHLLPPSDGEVVYQGTYDDPALQGTLHKFVAGYSEPSKQLSHTRIIYDLEGKDGTLRRTTEEVAFRWTGRYEMELLLAQAGYTVEKVYGGYDLEEFGDASERMIFVARA